VTRDLRRIKLFHLVQMARTAPFEASDQEIEDYYREHHEEFALPFQFHMRMIFLSAYEPYTVQEGDTPSAIAAKISGDPARAVDIRDMRHRRLLRSWSTSPEVIDRESRALAPGEELMVPMGEENREQVRRRLGQIREGIHTEEDFIAAAQRYSESEGENKGEELGPFPQRGTEFLPEYLEAGHSLPLHTVSDVISTKHGYSLVMITQRQENEYRPLADVRGHIASTVKNEKAREAALAHMRDMLARHGVTLHEVPSVDLMNLSSPEETRVVAEIPGEPPVTVGELGANLRGMNPRFSEQLASQPENYLLNYLLVDRTDVVDRECDELGATWLEPVLEAARLLEEANPYVRHVINDEAANMTDEMLRAYCQQHLSDFTPPPRVTYRALVRHLTVPTNASEEERAAERQRVLQQIMDALTGVTTVEDFQDRVEEWSDETTPENATPEIRGRRVDQPLTSNIQQVAEVLADAPLNAVTGPFVAGNTVMAVWVESRTEPATPTFEEVRDQVSRALERERRSTLFTQRMEQQLQSVHFQLVSPETTASPEAEAT
jgi:hypothetical protein